jgi:small-conductance mechanosensitive channel
VEQIAFDLAGLAARPLAVAPLGTALGFAFKDTLENYLAGILMMPAPAFPPVTMW